jgi:hypothetical protein
MGQAKPYTTTPIWYIGTENPRPQCPACDTRMILVQRPAPPKFECLRCSHTEPAHF